MGVSKISSGMTRVAVVLACAVVCSLSFSGLAHAAIPHDHGAGESVAWQSLHASLSSTALYAAVAVLFIVTGTAMSPAATISRVSIPELRYVEHLRRGIHKYRKFR